MRGILFLSLLVSALAQTSPAGWKVMKDSKGGCDGVSRRHNRHRRGHEPGRPANLG